MLIDEFIRKLPKAELNIHIEGCLTPELILKIAERNKTKLPYKDIDEIKKSFEFSDYDSFVKLFLAHIVVLQTEEDFYDLTLHYLQNAKEQNIRHAEFTFDPQMHLSRGIEFEPMIKGIIKAVNEAKVNLKISSYPILCFARDKSEAEALKIFEMALPYKDQIVAVGLTSCEVDNPPSRFKSVFARAREQGFLTIAVAGERGPCDYIWQAMDELDVSRIDHGIQCMHDQDLISRLASKQIPLTVCPISNIKLGIFSTMREHPIKRMFDNGLCVSVNSDCPAYFKADINDNFLAVNSALKLNKHVIYELAKNSFNSSFLEYEPKEKFLTELDRFYKQASK